MRINSTTVPTGRDSTYDTSEVHRLDSSGGSEGSSDFSTATMTVSGFPTGVIGGITLGGLIWIEDGYLSSAGSSMGFPNGDYEVVMYKGEGFFGVTAESGWTISGNASAEDGSILYTGDFTISAV